MKRKNTISILAAILTTVLASLACGQQVVITPTVSPEITLTDNTPTRPTSSPVPPATEPATQAATARVIAGAVNVRHSPDGDPTGEYVYSGMPVTVLEYSEDGDWVRIAEPAGWVYIGCLSVDTERKCEAAE